MALNLSPILAVGEPSSNAENEGVHYTVYEYDAIVAKKREGIDVSEIEAQLSIMSKLSAKELHTFGLTTKKAELLKTYDGTGIENNELLRAALGELDITITAPSTSTSAITAKLSWNWTSAPLFYAATDVIACSWQGYDMQGHPIGVEFKNTSTAYFHYYDLTYGTQHMGTVSGQFVNNTYDPFGHVEAPLPRLNTNGTGYAKKGDVLIRVAIPSNVSNSISNVTMRLAYGYVTSGGYTYSISFPFSLGISFNGKTTAMFDRTVVIRSNGQVSDLN